MKQFDLEKAIAGEPVVTRNGSPVRILCTDRVGDQYPIVALIRDDNYDTIVSYTKEGFIHLDKEAANDLFMAPKKKDGWINICITEDGYADMYDTTIYVSKEKALQNRDTTEEYVCTTKVEWEE